MKNHIIFLFPKKAQQWKTLLLIAVTSLLCKTSRAQNWSITGNTGTLPSTNFIGTTDADLVFKIYNVNAGLIDYSIGNTFLGYQAGVSTVQASNTGMGYQALNLNTNGNGNSAFGNQTLAKNTTGGGNTGCGFGALYSNTTGTQNTSVGSGSGEYNTTGSNNTYLGFQAGPGSGGPYSNSTALGMDAVVTASNQIVFGNSSISKTILTSGSFGIATSTPAASLDVNGTAIAPGIAGQVGIFRNGNSAVFVTANMPAAWDFNNLTQVNDNGIFWADNYGVQNNSSGLVIAPWAHSATGIRIDASGKVDFEGSGSGTALYVGSGKVDIEGEPNGSTGLVVGTGNVGIGTSNPQSTVEIYTTLTSPATNTHPQFEVTNPNGPMFSVDQNGDAGFSGNVVIGPPGYGGGISPYQLYNSMPYPLDVYGTIWCQELKVCLSGCDFVFDKDYKLMPLNELENYLELNHHLPGIASAKEMEGSDGVALGKMNSQLLQKVEELTLYTIQLKKQLDAMQAEISKMKEGK